MPEATDQSDAKFEDANVRLNDGLVTCRSVVNDYRALILGVGSTTEDSAKQVEVRPVGSRQVSKAQFPAKW